MDVLGAASQLVRKFETPLPKKNLRSISEFRFDCFQS